MEAYELIRQFGKLSILALDEGDLAGLLEVADTLRADDTCLAGWIRVLAVGGQILVQEETLDKEILLRRLDSREAAERFVEHRLSTYERMWDGCGCKIDYHQESEGE
jgi:hypothetical protein